MGLNTGLDTGLNRWAVWLTIAITVLDAVDPHGLATLVGLIADVELPSRLAQSRFFQQLQQLQPFQRLRWLCWSIRSRKFSARRRRSVIPCSTSGVARCSTIK